MKALSFLLLVACTAGPTLTPIEAFPPDHSENVRMARTYVLRAWLAQSKGHCDTAQAEMSRARRLDPGSTELLSMESEMRRECEAQLGRGSDEGVEEVP